jgi:hypothetical protein
MELFSAFLVLFSFIAFVLGMINPKLVLWFGLKPKRSLVALIYIGLFIFAVVIKPDARINLKGAEEGTTSKKPEQTQSDSTQPETDTQKSEQESEVETSIGKETSVGHFSYIINGIKFKKTVGGEFGSETADGIYLLVDLTIKNTSDETRTLDGSCFYLTDLDGVKFEYSINGSTALEMSGMKSLFLKECQPRIKTKGILIFEVPEKGEYYLHLAGSFMGTNSVKILLK